MHILSVDCIAADTYRYRCCPWRCHLEATHCSARYLVLLTPAHSYSLLLTTTHYYSLLLTPAHYLPYTYPILTLYLPEVAMALRVAGMDGGQD